MRVHSGNAWLRVVAIVAQVIVFQKRLQPVGPLLAFGALLSRRLVKVGLFRLGWERQEHVHQRGKVVDGLLGPLALGPTRRRGLRRLACPCRCRRGLLLA